MTYGGAVWEIFKLVKLARNVTFTIVRPDKYRWGDCNSPTDCDGMIGMVNRGEVDLAIGLLIALNQTSFINDIYLESCFQVRSHQGPQGQKV